MRRTVFAAFLLAVLAWAAPATSVGATPTCFGKPATHVMHAGDGPYLGAAGNDVVVGSAGPDAIPLNSSGGGTDLACGDGDDKVLVYGPGSKADGGAETDQVFAAGGGLARGGGSGSDRVQNQYGNPTIYCGSGYDQVQPFTAIDVRRCEQVV